MKPAPAPLEGGEFSTGSNWKASLDGEHWVPAKTAGASNPKVGPVDAFIASGFFRAGERFANSAGHKAEGCSPLHDHGLPLISGSERMLEHRNADCCPTSPSINHPATGPRMDRTSCAEDEGAAVIRRSVRIFIVDVPSCPCIESRHRRRLHET
jgi:hypothetical protein